MSKDLKLVLFIILVLFVFNLVALYTLNFKLEDNIGAIDILIEHIYKGG